MADVLQNPPDLAHIEPKCNEYVLTKKVLAAIRKDLTEVMQQHEFTTQIAELEKKIKQLKEKRAEDEEIKELKERIEKEKEKSELQIEMIRIDLLELGLEKITFKDIDFKILKVLKAIRAEVESNN